MPDKFTYVKKGYDPAEVDECVNSLEAVIRSYKEKDAAIKNAIVNAQIAADNIILNAKNRAYEIKENSIRQIEDIIVSIEEQKKLLDEFQTEYNAQVQKYLKQVNDGDISAIRGKIHNLERYLNSFVNENAAFAEGQGEA